MYGTKRGADAAGMTHRGRVQSQARSSFVRLTAAVLALVAGLCVPQLSTPVARAADICSTSYCASIQIVEMGGPGSGRVTSDPAGIDCAVSASGFAGTCFYTFAWSKLISSIYVDISVGADANSYVCMITCTGPGGSIGTSVALNPGDHATLSPKFELAQDNLLILSKKGTGTGRWTTSPAGIDCRYVNGAATGTCEGHFYTMPGSPANVQVIANPDAGSFACFRGVTSCSAPDATGSAGTSWSGTTSFEAMFWTTIPVTISVSGSGHVTSPTGFSCPSTCSKWLPPFDGLIGDRLVLTATPAAGWHIAGWTLKCTSTSLNCVLNVVDAAYNPSPTGTMGLYYNGYSGATIGVVFERDATPPPSLAPTPRTTPTTSPMPTARAGSSPAADPSGAIRPTPGITAPPVSVVPGASPGPDSTGAIAPTAPGSASTTAGPVAIAVGQSPGSSSGSNGSTAPADVTGPAAGSAFDPVWLLVIALLILALFAIGLRAGRGRRSQPS